MLREQAPLPVDRAYGVALKAAAGLRAIHEAGILHRDLKTSNIMIDAKEQVRLVDFGIAKALPNPDHEGSSTDTPITGNDAVVGTPAYMSPEQVMGWPLDARSDIYSFGIVLFELFTGQLPFRGSSRAATLRKQLEEPPPLDGPLGQSLPTGLAPILARAMAKDPDRRYADVPELIRDLERTRDSFQTDTLDVLPATRPLRWLLYAFALAAAVGLFALMGGRRSEESRLPETKEGRRASTIPPPPTTSVSILPTSPTLGPTSAAPSRRPLRRPSPPSTTPASAMPSTTVPAAVPTIITTTTMPPVPTTLAATPTITVPSKPVERPAHCLSCPAPLYPPAAERYGLEGRIELEIAVDAKGNVTATRVLSGHNAFRSAAQKAVRSWRFVPATRDGVPVEDTLRRIVEFRQDRPQ